MKPILHPDKPLTDGQIIRLAQARVFAVLTQEWKTVREIASELSMPKYQTARALQSLEIHGEVDWKCSPKSSYRRKLKGR